MFNFCSIKFVWDPAHRYGSIWGRLTVAGRPASTFQIVSQPKNVECFKRIVSHGYAIGVVTNPKPFLVAQGTEVEIMALVAADIVHGATVRAGEGPHSDRLVAEFTTKHTQRTTLAPSKRELNRVLPLFVFCVCCGLGWVVNVRTCRSTGL